MTAETREEAIQKLGELIRNVRVAMLTTLEEDQTLRSRPMATQEVEFDGDLWFFTKDDSPKAQEIQREQHVNVSYADPEQAIYVSVSGKAQILHDTEKAKALWRPAYKAWFPEGLDDPELALLKVRVEKAEYWDAPSSRLVALVGFIKAIATGQPYHAGETRELELANR